MKGDKRQKFWVVINENFPTRVSFKHDNLDSAIKEAKRLAKISPYVKFVVMESVVAFEVDNIVEIEYVENDCIPF